MSQVLTLSFLFFMGSIAGWVLELFFRRFLSSANPERKWINPGFCTGPYVPLYGLGLCAMYLIVSLEKYSVIESVFWTRALLFLTGAVAMTVIEYIAGTVSLKVLNVRLWDYSNQWGNINGLICPKFSLAWAALVAVYYFAIHPYILDAINWLSNNLAFSFVIGFFYGVFVLDVIHSAQLVTKLRRFAAENDVVVRYERLKEHIRAEKERRHEKQSFLFPFKSSGDINEHLREMLGSYESRRRSRGSKRGSHSA